MRLARYLGEHKAALLLVFVLLLAQAACDLAIPAFTAQIVDVGIQQGGIEDAAPSELTEASYDGLSVLLSGDDLTLFEQSYDHDAQRDRYVLNEQGRAQRAELNQALTLPLVLLHPDVGGENLDGRALVDSYQAGELSRTELDAALAQFETSLAEADEDLLPQQGLAAAKAEYRALEEDLPAIQMGYLLQTGGLMLGFAAISMLSSILIGFLAARTGTKIGRKLREQLFNRVVAFSDHDVDRFGAASLITRGTNDIQLVQMVCIILQRMVLYSPILAIGGIVMVAQTTLSMWWVIALAVVGVLVVIAVLFSFTMPKFRIMQKLIDRVNLVARESLTGMPVVRAFGREAHEEARFGAANDELMRTQLFTNRAMALMMPFMTLIMNGTSVLIVWIGASFVDLGTLQTGDLIALITYSMMIVMSFMMIGMIAIMLPRASVAAGRVDEVIAYEPSIRDPADPAVVERAIAHFATAAAPGPDTARDLSADELDELLEGVPEAGSGFRKGVEIAFEDVCFRYDDDSDNVLDHVSFVAPAGKTCALVGSTGSGKSTVLKLIERFQDVSSGRVTVDGVDVRDIPQETLHSLFGYVPQKAFLFSGTVKSNLDYAGSISDERRQMALDVSQAAEFVDGKLGGLQAEIAQGGTNVSGGQRQRLAIARAIAVDARGYLFDDSFSALDYKTDAALRKGLKTRLAGSTVLIVAQRIATIMNADHIVVLDEGRVVGQGTHDELLHTCREYREIALSQFSPEELFGPKVPETVLDEVAEGGDDDGC